MSEKSQIDAVLERVARKATTAAQRSGEGCWGNVAEVLERRLKPLLEAGQGMRDDESSRGQNNRKRMTTSATLWDARLREASKP